MKATVTKIGLAVQQVCVPKEWTDAQVLDFADTEAPSGLDHGWLIRKNGHKDLDGDAERVPCSEHPENIHITMEC